MPDPLPLLFLAAAFPPPFGYYAIAIAHHMSKAAQYRRAAENRRAAERLRAAEIRGQAEGRRLFAYLRAEKYVDEENEVERVCYHAKNNWSDN